LSLAAAEVARHRSRERISPSAKKRKEELGIVDSLANLGNLSIPVLPDQTGVLAKMSVKSMLNLITDIP